MSLRRQLKALHLYWSGLQYMLAHPGPTLAQLLHSRSTRVAQPETVEDRDVLPGMCRLLCFCRCLALGWIHLSGLSMALSPCKPYSGLGGPICPVLIGVLYVRSSSFEDSKGAVESWGE